MGKRGVKALDGAEDLVRLTAKVPEDTMQYICEHFPEGIAVGVRALLSLGISVHSLPAAPPQPKKRVRKKMKTSSK